MHLFLEIIHHKSYIFDFKDFIMKLFLALIFTFFAITTGFAQHEYSPIQEKELKYQDWTYKNVVSGEDVNLRQFAKGKKLVMVVYFAAWCKNWKFQAPLTQSLYAKYKDKGFDIIGVSEYESLDLVKKHLTENALTFTVVSESESRDAKQKTLHYGYRMKTGDTRGWGSPWNLFLNPSEFKKGDETLTKKAFLVNGEFINDETEVFIRQKLGLPAEEKKAAIADKENKTIEACSEKETLISLKKP
jgi:peroxiredoxin